MKRSELKEIIRNVLIETTDQEQKEYEKELKKRVLAFDKDYKKIFGDDAMKVINHLKDYDVPNKYWLKIQRWIRDKYGMKTGYKHEADNIMSGWKDLPKNKKYFKR